MIQTILIAAFAGAAFGTPFTKDSTLAVANRQESISYTTSCDAAREPSNWDDCTDAIDVLLSDANGDPNYVWSPTQPTPYYNYVTVDSCIAKLIWYTGESFTDNKAVNGMRNLLEICKPADAGGKADNNDGVMGVEIDNSSSPNKRSARIDTEAMKGYEVTRKATTHEVVEKISVRDGEEWQQAYSIANASPRYTWQQVQASLPAGSSWSITKSDEKTWGISETTEVSADLFKIFSVSQSVTYSYGETSSYSTTVDIENTCPGQGYLYFAPAFTQYHGGYTNGGPSPMDFFIPTENGDQGGGSYELACSG